MESIDIARKAVEAASEIQATDISLLDVRDICSFSSFFVLCSGESERQLKAIAEEVESTLKQAGTRVIHSEGETSDWVLLDFGDVIVHIFAPSERAYFQFDELWSKAKPVLRIQ